MNIYWILPVFHCLVRSILYFYLLQRSKKEVAEFVTDGSSNSDNENQESTSKSKSKSKNKSSKTKKQRKQLAQSDNEDDNESVVSSIASEDRFSEDRNKVKKSKSKVSKSILSSDETPDEDIPQKKPIVKSKTKPVLDSDDDTSRKVSKSKSSKTSPKKKVKITSPTKASSSHFKSREYISSTSDEASDGTENDADGTLAEDNKIVPVIR
jgi:hypothetical protein